MRIIALAVLLAVAAFQLTATPERQTHIDIHANTTAEAAPIEEQQQQSAAPAAAVSTMPEKQEQAPEAPKPDTHTAWMIAAGIAPEDYDAVDYIVGQESGWCATKWQGQHHCADSFTARYSTSNSNVGYGLCQSTPAIKMSSMGEGWETDPVLQLKWCAKHVERYGGWKPAAEFKRCTGYCYSPYTKQIEYKATPWV